MHIAELDILGAWRIEPRAFGDDRGEFWEWYRFDALEAATGRSLDLRQANASVSRRGVVRGVHFADLPGQAKYVTVAAGAILDFVVDIRVGSPTFGRWHAVHLDAVDRHAVFLTEGLGHAFVALADDTVVTYLVTDVFRPDHEHGITPLDPTIGLDFPFASDELVLSPKDRGAPTLAEAHSAGLLPEYEAALLAAAGDRR